MHWMSGVTLFAVIWWTVLFAVLPWGVRPSSNPGKGHAASAPERPMLARKFIATTVIAVAIWLAIFAVVRANLFSFRDWAAL
jgi:predicted secreted protein